MNTEKLKSVKRASVDYALQWNKIDWAIVEKKVNKLPIKDCQNCIVK